MSSYGSIQIDWMPFQMVQGAIVNDCILLAHHAHPTQCIAAQHIVSFGLPESHTISCLTPLLLQPRGLGVACQSTNQTPGATEQVSPFMSISVPCLIYLPCCFTTRPRGGHPSNFKQHRTLACRNRVCVLAGTFACAMLRWAEHLHN